MNKFEKYGCLALLLASAASHAQTASNLNPLERGFISNDALMAANAPMTTAAISTANSAMPAAPPPPSAATPIGADVTKKAPPASIQQILDKINAGKVGSGATGATGMDAPLFAAPQAAATTPIQRYIPDTDNNSARIDFYQAKGDQKSGFFAQKYGQPALTLPSASSNPKQLEFLQPYIVQLRKAGVEEGKISVELNRLTPAQFAHWALLVSN